MNVAAKVSTIARLAPDPDGLDFAALQRDGLTLLQQLAGEHWTDYNPHDPGVTLLEQLCYALTDLAHRSSLPHEDYLAASDGAIDLARHALHRPQDVFPSEPVTNDDWRRLLFDRVPEIDDIWLEPQSGSGDRALMMIRFTATDEPGSATVARSAIRRIFSANRALCQDIASLTELRTRNFYLSGDIQVRSMRDAAEVYADIIFQCAQLVGSGLQLQPYENEANHGAGAATAPTLDELLNGPLTEHGRVLVHERRKHNSAISPLRLIGVILGIEGVQKVHRLQILDDSGRPLDGGGHDLGEGHVPRLPLDQKGGSLQLHFMGKSLGELSELKNLDHQANHLMQNATADACTALRDAARPYLNKLRYERRTLRERHASLDHLVTTPRGSGRPLNGYHSIQHELPAIYGVNAHGVPASAPAQARAAARQLKAYLYGFEQVMANYVQGLAHIGQVFSIERRARRSYYSQPLSNAMLPDIAMLYRMAPDDIAEALDDIRQRFDPHEDRRNRVLDVMLAMYGQRYTQQMLRKFNVYFTARQDMRAWLLQNKRAFLLHIAALSKQRATAFRYDLPAWNTNNVSGAQRKIAILLGLHHLRCCRPLCQVLDRYGLRIVDSNEANAASFTELLERLQAPAPVPASAPLLHVPRSVLHQAFPHEGKPAPAEVVMLSPAQLRRLRLLNMKCEGLHLVEHTLLRPRRSAAPHREVPEDFYRLQVSVIFPGWTVRFASSEFRKLAQETVALNLPAHVMPHFYWLSHDDMARFELHYPQWLDCLRAVVTNAEQHGRAGAERLAALDAASYALLQFLQSLPPQAAGRGHWV